jgi:hypothetical protein
MSKRVIFGIRKRMKIKEFFEVNVRSKTPNVSIKWKYYVLQMPG